MLRRTNQNTEDLSAEWADDSARDAIRDATNEEIREHFFQLSKLNATRSTTHDSVEMELGLLLTVGALLTTYSFAAANAIAYDEWDNHLAACLARLASRNESTYEFWDWCDTPHKYMPTCSWISILLGAYGILEVLFLYLSWSLSRPGPHETKTAKIFFELHRNEIYVVHVAIILSLIAAAGTSVQFFMFKFQGTHRTIFFLAMVWAGSLVFNLVNIVRKYRTFLSGSAPPPNEDKNSLDRHVRIDGTASNPTTF